MQNMLAGLGRLVGGAREPLSLMLSQHQHQQVRFRWFKDKMENRTIWRYGYVDKVKQEGPLPRITNRADRIKALELYTPTNSWAEHKALAGQNDYIDLLGNDDIHPKQIMYHVPKYLRGVHRKERHVQIALKRQHALEHTPFPETYPKKWEHWCNQITRDLRWLNKHVDQNWWANYKGIKEGPVRNPFQPKLF